jgi:hypothetical protein
VGDRLHAMNLHLAEKPLKGLEAKEMEVAA